MATLKEVKGRIQSVSNTLKITSAMKLVASAKLRKAQAAITGMLPYQHQLGIMLSHLTSSGGVSSAYGAERPPRRVALVCFSSHSSLCGGFNANAIRQALETLARCQASGAESVTVYSIGKKMADAMRKAGYPSPGDYSALLDRPSYEGAAALGRELMEGFAEGRFDRVILVYNHFKSTASQVVTDEVFLPLAMPAEPAPAGASGPETDYILEPDRQTVVDALLPQVLLLKIYTVLLDTCAAEHAARTIAMQTATDNGEDLLQELRLAYNKGRQQKITEELLDLEGGSLR